MRAHRNHGTGRRAPLPPPPPRTLGIENVAVPSVHKPILVMQDADRMARAGSHHISKARLLATRLLSAPNEKGREKRVGELLRRLDRAEAALDPKWLTEYRKEHRRANPRQHPASSEPPADMTCRKCKHTFEDPKVFFMDDGQGEYGYTGRCIECRGKRVGEAG